MSAATDANAVTVAPMLPLGTNGTAEASINGKKQDRIIRRLIKHINNALSYLQLLILSHPEH